MAENEDMIEKDVNENKVKKISLTNLIIFILSCIVLVLFVVQIAINTDDYTETKMSAPIEVQSETDIPTDDFQYRGTPKGQMITNN